MLGPSLLFAPAGVDDGLPPRTLPNGLNIGVPASNATSRSVHFPTAGWRSWWDGTVVAATAGPKTLPCPIAFAPLYGEPAPARSLSLPPMSA